MIERFDSPFMKLLESLFDLTKKLQDCVIAIPSPPSEPSASEHPAAFAAFPVEWAGAGRH